MSNTELNIINMADVEAVAVKVAVETVHTARKDNHYSRRPRRGQDNSCPFDCRSIHTR